LHKAFKIKNLQNFLEGSPSICLRISSLTVIPDDSNPDFLKFTPTVQEAQAAARFQRGKPPRNLCHLSFAHARLTFGRRVQPSAFRLAPHPASHGSLASPASQKSEQTGFEPLATLRG
jgi:hypothetical protein